MRSLVFLAVMMASPAFGLSCKAPNFGEQFNYVAGVEEVYSVGYGQLRPLGEVPPYVDGQPRDVKMRFVGKMLGRLGFGETGTVDVTVKTECAGSFCGPIPTTQTPMLAFLEHQSDGLTLRSAACTPDFLLNPSLGQISAVRACMTSGTCGADEIDAFIGRRD